LRELEGLDFLNQIVVYADVLENRIFSSRLVLLFHWMDVNMQRLCVIVGASDECLHSLTEALHSHEVRAIGVSDARAALRLFEQMHVDAVVLNADALGHSAFQALRALVASGFANTA
jgi:hypothetical protein